MTAQRLRDRRVLKAYLKYRRERAKFNRAVCLESRKANASDQFYGEIVHDR